MKQLFTLLVTFVFFLLMSKINAQITTSVHKYNSGTSLYEEDNIRGETLNVNAGQTIHISVHIKEQSKTDFSIATSYLSLQLNNSCTFEASNNLDYNYIPATGDIGDNNYVAGSTSIKNRSITVEGQDFIDEIIITNIKIVIPSEIADQTNYTLTLTHDSASADVLVRDVFFPHKA